jgi:hypothetical protein
MFTFFSRIIFYDDSDWGFLSFSPLFILALVIPFSIIRLLLNPPLQNKQKELSYHLNIFCVSSLKTIVYR